MFVITNLHNVHEIKIVYCFFFPGYFTVMKIMVYEINLRIKQHKKN